MEHQLAAPIGTALLPERVSKRLAVAVGVGPAVRAFGIELPEPAMWDALLGAPALTTSEIQVLSSVAEARSVAPGQTVFTHKALATSLVALASGEVALGLRTADGTFRTERIVRGPAWLDQSSAWLGEAHAMDAQALGPARVVELPCTLLTDGLSRHAHLAERMIRGLAREVKALAVNTHELMHKDAPARLAHWLAQRCEPLDGEPGQGIVRLNERKRDVASQLAITPETLSRLMRSFTRQGVIEVSGYLVRVLDIAALERLAEG